MDYVIVEFSITVVQLKTMVKDNLCVNWQCQTWQAVLLHYVWQEIINVSLSHSLFIL